MPVTRKELVQSVVERIADYREGDVPRATPQHVERWIGQFRSDDQDALLAELDYVLERTYISRKGMTAFLSGLATNAKFCGNNPTDFWRKANLLSIQQGGNSQRELLAMFSGILQQELNLDIKTCGSSDGPYIYLDDGIFSGMRTLSDLRTWLSSAAPAKFELRIVVAALHWSGQYYANREMEKIRKTTGKDINVSWWRILELENRRAYKDRSDVLWPTVVPDGHLPNQYVKYLTEEEPKYKLELRTPGSIGGNKFFPSDAARIHMEQALLSAGFLIRSRCPNLPEVARPLGFTGLKTFGFGSTIVTFRNCPNNAPLAFWVSDPWYPLFPRSTNTDAFMRNLMQSFSIRKRSQS